MVALSLFAGGRLRILHQPMLVDFQMRMRFAVGRSGHGLQHPHGSRQALPVLCPRLARTSAGNDRDHRSAAPDNPSHAVDMAHPSAGRPGDVPPGGRARRIGPGLVGRVLEPLDLADSPLLPPYWNFIWDSNPPTYYSSQSSSGSPLKSSTAAEADDAGPVCPSAHSKAPVSSPARLPSPDRQGGDNQVTLA